MYDVIVIGAGPTGCTAAKILAERGYKVLLAERLKLPRYKSCSGVLIKKSMNLVKEYFGEAVPAFTMCEPVENRGMIFTNDKGKEYPFKQEGLNVWRSSFDNWLASKAAAAGATVRDCTSALSCREEDGSVIVTLHERDTYTEKASYLIDCEGVTGAFKGKLTKETPQYITTFQTFNEGRIDLDYHYFYAYLQPELSEYDAWFNVKDNLLVLGAAVKDVRNIEYFYNKFIEYMKQKHSLQIDRQIKQEKWLMPQVRPGCHIDYGTGHVLFAGEIAGFLNPMGEGISAGMESGYSAACAIDHQFGHIELIYADYKERTHKLKNYMTRQWNYVAGMTDTFKDMKL